MVSCIKIKFPIQKNWEKRVFEEEEEPKIIRVLVLRFMMWVSQHHDPKCHRNIFGNILAPNYIRVFFSLEPSMLSDNSGNKLQVISNPMKIGQH